MWFTVCFFFFFFFFNDTATTEIYTTVHTLSLHERSSDLGFGTHKWTWPPPSRSSPPRRSEEHTSELQSRTVISYAVFCLKKKKKIKYKNTKVNQKKKKKRQNTKQTN